MNRFAQNVRVFCGPRLPIQNLITDNAEVPMSMFIVIFVDCSVVVLDVIATDGDLVPCCGFAPPGLYEQPVTSKFFNIATHSPRVPDNQPGFERIHGKSTSRWSRSKTEFGVFQIQPISRPMLSIHPCLVPTQRVAACCEENHRFFDA